MDKDIIRDDKGRFVEGSTGNPTGRPADGESICGLLSEYLNGKKTEKSKQTRKQILIARLFSKVEEGDIAAIRLILSYTDGLPIAKIQGEFTENINNNPQWIFIRTKLLKIIDTHPELRDEMEGVFDDDSS